MFRLGARVLEALRSTLASLAARFGYSIVSISGRGHGALLTACSTDRRGGRRAQGGIGRGWPRAPSCVRCAIEGLHGACGHVRGGSVQTEATPTAS